jgi:hypothetical protein
VKLSGKVKKLEQEHEVQEALGTLKKFFVLLPAEVDYLQAGIIYAFNSSSGFYEEWSIVKACSKEDAIRIVKLTYPSLRNKKFTRVVDNVKDIESYLE